MIKYIKFKFINSNGELVGDFNVDEVPIRLALAADLDELVLTPSVIDSTMIYNKQKVYWAGTNIPRSVHFLYLPWSVKKRFLKLWFWGGK